MGALLQGAPCSKCSSAIGHKAPGEPYPAAQSRHFTSTAVAHPARRSPAAAGTLA